MNHILLSVLLIAAIVASTVCAAESFLSDSDNTASLGPALLLRQNRFVRMLESDGNHLMSVSPTPEVVRYVERFFLLRKTDSLIIIFSVPRQWRGGRLRQLGSYANE